MTETNLVKQAVGWSAPLLAPRFEKQIEELKKKGHKAKKVEED